MFPLLFSFFSFSRLAGETVSAPPCGLKFCTQSFLVKVPALKERYFPLSALKTPGLLLLLLTSHPGSLSLTVLLCDVLATKGYILRDNSMPWGYKPVQTGSMRFDCALFPGQINKCIKNREYYVSAFFLFIFLLKEHDHNLQQECHSNKSRKHTPLSDNKE